MKINDTTDNLGIFQEVDSLCDSDENSYPLESKARRANIALEKLELIALMADGTWQFDDSNYSSLPTGLQNAIDGQQEYDFDDTLLFLERVEIKDVNGIWRKLDPMDEIETDETQTDLAVQATPSRFYVRGNKFGFDTVPKSTNMMLTNGIKVFFKRTASTFVATDTTKEPGIASPFHGSLLAPMIALPYCKTYKKDRVPQLQADIVDETKLFKQYYASRNKSEPGKMTMRRVNPH